MRRPCGKSLLILMKPWIMTHFPFIRLWERLGFTKAGVIPRAGRLKCKNGDGEEYIDAWIFYKSFLETDVGITSQ